MRTKRVASGAYTVSHKEYVVTVDLRSDLKAWIAAANWDRSLYTDPIRTKRGAVREARRMIDSAIADDIRRVVASNQTRAAALTVGC